MTYDVIDLRENAGRKKKMEQRNDEEKSGDGKAGKAKLSQFDMRSPRKGILAVLLAAVGSLAVLSTAVEKR